jgi:hypothetical protein
MNRSRGHIQRIFRQLWRKRGQTAGTVNESYGLPTLCTRITPAPTGGFSFTGIRVIEKNMQGCIFSRWIYKVIKKDHGGLVQ